MPSNHLILCHPLLLPSVFPNIRVFSNESVLCIKWCWRRNETPTLQSGLNLFTLTLCFLQLLYFISFAQQSTGQVAKHHNSVTIQCAGAGRDNFYLRLCFGELPYQLRIRFVPGSVPFEESEKHPCVQEMFFSHRNKQDS